MAVDGMRETLNFVVSYAGEQLGYSPEVIAGLQHPDEKHIYERGDGVVASRTIHRSFSDGTGLKRSGGGSRIEVYEDGKFPDIEAASSNSDALSGNQTLKHLTVINGQEALAEDRLLEEGGAKLDLFVPRSIFESEVASGGVLDWYVEQHAEHILGGDRHGPDMLMLPEHMARMSHKLTRITENPSDRAWFTGKDPEDGGVKGREDSTSRGALKALELLLEPEGLSLRGLTIAIEGAGNVGYHLARLAPRYGARVMGISDKYRSVAAHDLAGPGLRADQDLKFDSTNRCLASYNTRLAAESMRPADLRKLDVDLLILGGPSLSVRENKDVVPNRTALVANTAGTERFIMDYLARGGILYPEIVLNPGGTIASGKEHETDGAATRGMVQRAISTGIRTAVSRTIEASGGDPHDYFWAANKVAVEALHDRDRRPVLVS
jgi:glutamate dehydrogenase/leucine dehydrogenase